MRVGSRRVTTLPTDPWGVLGKTIKVLGSWWQSPMSKPDRKRRWPCTLVAFAPEHKWSPSDSTPAYVIEEGKERYLMRAGDVWKLLPQQLHREIEAAETQRSALPPPFVLEQILVLDEHHKRCRLGKASEYDCVLPVDNHGNWCSAEDGGEHQEWSDVVAMKYAKEARFLFGMMLRRDADGKLVGDRIKPYEYTGQWIVGVKSFNEAIKAEVARANRLKSGGNWACTKDYTQEQLAALPGGRYEAWRIEKEGSSGRWREDVMERIAKGEHGLVCVTELMQHAIHEGNRLFAQTPYKNNWLLFHDHLSAWWEKEAQNYLREQGFFDPQVRAFGETNVEFSRYHESLVGNRPEMCALDFHLFYDLEYAVLQNILATAGLPLDDRLRYDNGTPRELASALRRTWEHHPTSERIVEDTSRLPLVVDKINEYNGSLFPDFEMAVNGCSKRKRKARDSTGCSRVYQPAPEVAQALQQRRSDLRAKVDLLLK